MRVVSVFVLLCLVFGLTACARYTPEPGGLSMQIKGKTYGADVGPIARQQIGQWQRFTDY